MLHKATLLEPATTAHFAVVIVGGTEAVAAAHIDHGDEIATTLAPATLFKFRVA